MPSAFNSIGDAAAGVDERTGIEGLVLMDCGVGPFRKLIRLGDLKSIHPCPQKTSISLSKATEPPNSES